MVVVLVQPVKVLVPITPIVAGPGYCGLMLTEPVVAPLLQVYEFAPEAKNPELLFVQIVLNGP